LYVFDVCELYVFDVCELYVFDVCELYVFDVCELYVFDVCELYVFDAQYTFIVSCNAGWITRIRLRNSLTFIEYTITLLESMEVSRKFLQKKTNQSRFGEE
jgi:hypothetical protein